MSRSDLLPVPVAEIESCAGCVADAASARKKGQTVPLETHRFIHVVWHRPPAPPVHEGGGDG